MSLSMYDASVPVFARNLNIVATILKKGEANAETRKIDPSVFLAARLAPDMYPLLKQVQLVSDLTKMTLARLAGVEAPSMPDDEKTFADLYARIKKTVDFVQSLTPAQLDGSETREIVLKFPNGEFKFTGRDFLFNFGLPNLFFHAATAYDILRHNGVELGKMDFMGASLT